MSSAKARKRKADDSDSDSDEGSSSQDPIHQDNFNNINNLLPQGSWTLKEKEKLLEALKSFRLSPSNITSITNIVGTKTKEQVASLIATIREKQSLKEKYKKLEGDATERIVPLEAWLPLVNDLVYQEPTDLSENLSKVMSVLGKNEVSQSAIHPKLNWPNIYRYMSGLLEDRAHLQPLTDLESYVVLDVMHSLSNTLQNSDVEEQRQMLRMKYKLLASDQRCFPRVSDRYKAVAMALSNDFSLLENKATTSSSSSTSSSSKDLLATPSTSTADKSGERAQEQLEPFSVTTASTAASTDTSIRIEPSTLSVAESSNSPSKTDGANFSVTVAKDVPIKIEDTTSGSSTDNSVDPMTFQTCPEKTAWTPESRYSRPRYFTMNPLCIPSKLLDFKAKKS